jgi:hypothetical protein
MDPRLRKVIVSSMAEVDAAFVANDGDLESIQLHVRKRTSLMDAVEINRRMLAGIRAKDALQIFNPELVARKAEAEAAVRAALESIDVKIFHAEKQVAATREEVVALQIKLARGPDVIRVGPSLRRRAVDREQVVFPVSLSHSTSCSLRSWDSWLVGVVGLQSRFCFSILGIAMIFCVLHFVVIGRRVGVAVLSVR